MSELDRGVRPFESSAIKLGVTCLIVFGTLMCTGPLTAQASPDGVRYSPQLHHRLDVPRVPFSLGRLVVGGHIDEVVQENQYLCTYQSGEVRSDCYISRTALDSDSFP